MHNKETNLLKILVFSNTHLTCMKEKSKVFPSFSVAGKEYSNCRQPSYRCLRGFQDSRHILSLCHKYNQLYVAQYARGQYKSVKWSSRLVFGQGKIKLRILEIYYVERSRVSILWLYSPTFGFHIPLSHSLSLPFVLFCFSTLLFWKAVTKAHIRAATIWRDLNLKKKRKANN